MRRWMFLASILFSAGLVCCSLSCSDSGDDGGLGPGTTDPEIDFIEHVARECASNSPDSSSNEFAPYIKSHTFEDKTLTLTIGFDAYCNPGFRESVTVTDTDIHIDLADTLAPTRCTCLFENDFTFSCSGTEELQIHFRATNVIGQSLVSGLDTLLVLSP